ncbi:MAG: SDR family oxidoreductase [Actinomycetota bacterium]
MSGSDQMLDPSGPFRHAGFDGQVAVITGGSQGLGLATAQLMKARGAAELLLVGRDRDKGAAAAAGLTDSGCRARFIAADLSSDDGTAAVLDRVGELVDDVHVFVNSAAATWRGTVWNTTPQMWDEMLAINVKAPGVLISGLARIMRERGIEGTMVLVSSIAHHGAMPTLWPYAASKHALEAMVKNAAFTLMPHRIRINTINPGWMDTPGEDTIQRRFHGAEDGWLESAEAGQPFGRLLKPTEVARGICFLASDESGMMTGASVDFDQTIPGVGDLPRPDVVPYSFDWDGSDS